MGGIAGGRKFEWRGVFFKVVLAVVVVAVAVVVVVVAVAVAVVAW